MADKEYYRALAQEKILELLEHELALIAPAEVVAKLGDDPRLPLPHGVRRIDQHHLGWAINELVRTGRIQQMFHRTKGARTVRVIVPADQHRRLRAIEDAVKRKAALHTRYLGWASGTPNHPGVLGDAAEKIVHKAIARSNGYLQLNPESGQTTLLRGVDVPGGALDNAAILSVIDRQTNTPIGMFDVVVEVKNLRLWIYPGDDELHQLLWKAATLQQALPDVHILPVLVCRQVAFVTGKMTNALGVYVIRTLTQLAPANLDQQKFAEVVDELGYRMDSSEDPAPAMIRHFNTSVPASARQLAERWRTVGAAHLPFYELLRRDDIDQADREALRRGLLEQIGIDDHSDDDPGSSVAGVTIRGDNDGS